MKLRGPIGYFVGGVLVPPGAPVEVTDPKEAERLKCLGFVEIAPEPATAATAPPADTPHHRHRRRSC